jgi:hypothetical protein
VPAQSWLYTCAVPVSGQCANAHLPSIGGDLVPENTAFVQVPLSIDTCTVQQLSVYRPAPRGRGGPAARLYTRRTSMYEGEVSIGFSKYVFFGTFSHRAVDSARPRRATRAYARATIPPTMLEGVPKAALVAAIGHARPVSAMHRPSPLHVSFRPGTRPLGFSPP